MKACLVFPSVYFLESTFPDDTQLVLLLKLTQSLALLLDHIAVREREEVQFILLHRLFLISDADLLLVFQDLICLDECVRLVHLVFTLDGTLVQHRLTLLLQEILLVLLALDFGEKLSVALLMDLID